MTTNQAQLPDSEILDLLGPTIQYVTPLPEDGDGYCVLKGTIAPGVVLPIHSHADRETFYILEGQLEALKKECWQTFGRGDVFDVPGGTKHAFRNTSSESASVLIVTTMALDSSEGLGGRSQVCRRVLRQPKCYSDSRRPLWRKGIGSAAPRTTPQWESTSSRSIDHSQAGSVPGF
jgi:quercetin dioxygenase-like cupin family protein